MSLSKTRVPIDRGQPLVLDRKLDDAAEPGDATDVPAGEVVSPDPTVVNRQAVPGAPLRDKTESVGPTATPKQLFTGGKKRRGKKSRKSRKGKKGRKGKKSRKNKRTKRR